MHRFWSKVKMGQPDECWPFVGACTGSGCVAFKIDRVVESAHRVTYKLTKGPIPEGFLVGQRCRNALCCNPRHLLLLRRRRPGRSDGERNGRRKISAADAAAIRSTYATRTKKRGTKARLARRYGLSNEEISRIIEGHRWRAA